MKLPFSIRIIDDVDVSLTATTEQQQSSAKYRANKRIEFVWFGKWKPYQPSVVHIRPKGVVFNPDRSTGTATTNAGANWFASSDGDYDPSEPLIVCFVADDEGEDE